MNKLILAGTICASLKILAQSSGTTEFVQATEDNLFHSCGEVESLARELKSKVPSHAYTLHLFPKSGRSLLFSFPSETDRVPIVLNWLSNYRPQTAPYASLYAVDGAYSFRCRDDQDHFMKSTGPEGDPLQLKLTAGEAVIWHFSITDGKMAHVFVVTGVRLENLDGQQLLAEVTQRLGARFVFLYVRNDPWFLGYTPDSVPFIFADSFKRITEPEYRASRTMVCRTDLQRCRVGPSGF